MKPTNEANGALRRPDPLTPGSGQRMATSSGATSLAKAMRDLCVRRGARDVLRLGVAERPDFIELEALGLASYCLGIASSRARFAPSALR